MNGAWIFVCGPSGAGKDSVIALAQQLVGERKDIVFARRMVTRPAQSGSDHDPVTEAVFHAQAQAGELSWPERGRGWADAGTGTGARRRPDRDCDRFGSPCGLVQLARSAGRTGGARRYDERAACAHGG